MEVILMEDIPSLGKVGDTIKVSDGYARNYLLARRKAIIATRKNVKALDHHKRLIEQKLHRLETDAEKLARKIEELSCTIAKPAGEGGKLFGAVTSSDIEKALGDNGISVDRKKIEIEEPIKNLGVYTVPIKLHRDVTTELKLWVVKE
jgi:large subunit ribosomal protein L9